MEPGQYLRALRRETTAFAGAAELDLQAHVPSCPGWSVRDLVAHLAGVHRMATVALLGDGAPPAGRPPLPGGEPLDVYRSGVDELLSALGAREATSPAWTFSPGETTAAFWFQRMAQETAVHRWDAENATRTPQPVEPRLAADGIDEVCDRFLTRTAPLTGHGETIHLHCTDTDGEWLWRITPQGTEVTREHTKSDVAARGTASDLLLALWGRVAPESLEVFGDRALLASTIDRLPFRGRRRN